MSDKKEMKYLEERNQKIIDAVIQKADSLCPGTLALIGINGSFMTGDYYEKSDLDLLILINDDRGGQLAHAFIQDDLQVGHDIYCVTWERLQSDAGYEHPNISKLMDAQIVYCADEKYKKRLEELRKTARDILSSPFSEEDYAKAEKQLKEAEHCYTSAMISEHRSDVLDGAAETGNRHLAFMSLISSGAMFSEIDAETKIDRYDMLEKYDPQDLHKTAAAYDDVLNAYRKEYEKAGIQVNHYPDIDAFARDYLSM